MTAEFHYREKYPKELRVQIANEDELHYLRLLFEYSPAGILKKFTEAELNGVNLTKEWKKKFIDKSRMADDGEPYDIYNVWTALHEEVDNLKVLEDASHV